MNRTLEHILPKVQKPARYTGGEYNAVVKDRSRVDLRYALCFPDTYEIGMSNLGCRILYGVMNERPDIWCERCFAPWGDMEEQLRHEGLLLYGLESGDPIAEFDIIGFSLGYEMAYTNVLNMLDLAGLALRSADRLNFSPLVVAGGTCCYNPEPLAPFVDFFVLGEGEEVTLEYIDLYRQARDEGWSKEEFLEEAAKIEGIYVPSFYKPVYRPDGTLESVDIKEGKQVHEVITKRIVQDMDKAYFPVKTIIPSTEIVHDRVMLELFRGCIRGCRFCQAGYAYRPVRSRSPELLAKYGREAIEDSGYQEMTLSSLSSTDYPDLLPLCDELLDYCTPRDIGLSLPSLRADTFSMGLMERLQRVRRGGLTFAPEAGTQRLRDAINKNLREEDLLQSCKTAFAGGWSGVKLYFMLGLPTETDEDVLGIADLARKVYFTWREYSPNKTRGVRITVSTSWFVPKPHTAFQWEGQIPVEEYQRRVNLLRDALKRDKSITYNWHDPQTSYLEAILSRGDRRLADVLEWVWAHGGKMDAWTEYFDYQRWLDGLAACGLDGDFYAHRERGRDEVFPWCRLSTGVDHSFLWHERELCYQSQTTPDCRTRCSGCGANKLLKGGGPVADRLLFTKTGRAKYISHLDLMRTFQRAFARAKIPIKHTEGFNPHPFVSIALPLSVGFSSQCEILEFGLLEGTSYGEVPKRLTAAMPEGIVVHQCYPAQRKLKELRYVNYIVTFDYPEGRPQETEPAIAALLSKDSLVVKKKSNKAKSGFTEVDIIPCVRSWRIECQSDTMMVDMVTSAQNPGLNPDLIRAAFCAEYPEYAPDFVTFHRRDVLDGEGKPFQ